MCSQMISLHKNIQSITTHVYQHELNMKMIIIRLFLHSVRQIEGMMKLPDCLSPSSDQKTAKIIESGIG